MTIIREFKIWSVVDGKVSPGTVVLRSDTYRHDFIYFTELMSEAWKDFPDAWEGITIQHYGGERYKNTWGIEFPAMDAPESYTRIEEVEKTL